jgi:hypothetical protein
VPEDYFDVPVAATYDESLRRCSTMLSSSRPSPSSPCWPATDPP